MAILSLAILSASSFGADRPNDPPVRIVELKGDNAAIGREHGRQLGKEIRLLHEKYLGALFPLEELRQGAAVAASLYRGRLLPEHRAELDALAAELRMDPDEVMLGNSFLDILPMMACSTVALPKEAASDGVARFGRNLDFPGLGVADRHSIVLVVRPKGRYAFASVTWPGMLGVLSGMNEHGLTLANMEVQRGVRLPEAMPYAFLYRAVLEQCRTVDEAVAFLSKTPRQTANNLMLMDAAGDRAVVEILPETVTVRRGREKTALVSTNHQRGRDAGTRGFCSRYDDLVRESARTFGKADAASVERMLGRVAQGEMTLQSMVFEPAPRVLHLALGAEATRRPYQRVDLKPYFRK